MRAGRSGLARTAGLCRTVRGRAGVGNGRDGQVSRGTVRPIPTSGRLPTFRAAAAVHGEKIAPQEAPGQTSLPVRTAARAPGDLLASRPDPSFHRSRTCTLIFPQGRFGRSSSSRLARGRVAAEDRSIPARPLLPSGVAFRTTLYARRFASQPTASGGTSNTRRAPGPRARSFARRAHRVRIGAGLSRSGSGRLPWLFVPRFLAPGQILMPGPSKTTPRMKEISGAPYSPTPYLPRAVTIGAKA